MIRQQPSSQFDNQQNGVYAFNLKLNVDFNSRHLSLNVPNQAPFAKKVYVPMTSYPPETNYVSFPHYIPIDNQQIAKNMPPTMPRCQSVQLNHHQEMQNGALQNHKNVQSMNTTSFRLQPSSQAIQCVICEKVVRSQEFASHLEQHRNKKKDKSRSSIRDSDVSIRNKNPEAEFAETINNHPQSNSFIPNSLNFSQSNIVYSNPCINIQNTSSPNIPINQLNQQMHSQSQLVYQPSYHNNSSHTSFNLSQTLSAQQIQHVNQPSFRQASNIYSKSSSFSRQHKQIQEQSRNSNSNSHRQLVIHQFPPNQMHPGRDINTLQFHRIQSMIIRPDPSRNDKVFQDCAQSNISRNSLPTKFSQIYALQRELQKPSTYSQQDSSSSDQESIKVYPSKSYRSSVTPQQQPLQRSAYTQKLSKTKIPVNYLARQEFITTSTHNSNSRNSKGLP